jgi:hypothetical protein
MRQTRFYIVAMLSLLGGCATQLDIHAMLKPGMPKAGPAARVLTFQSADIAPGDGGLLSSAQLQPGDIILSSAPSVASAGIQLFTLAPVSHAAIYVGEGKVVEAVRAGVRERSVDELIAQETLALVLRYPELTAEQSGRISAYALDKTGLGFNFLGVTLHVPFSIKRRVCELPLMPSTVRDACIRGVGVIHYLAAEESRLFCSQLVMQAYRHAGIPLTDADPRLISPADLLHMREGDVPSVLIRKPLRYVGHLKHQSVTVATLADMH